MYKICFKCKKKKLLSDFYKHQGTADKHLNKCKSCAKKDVKNRYNDPVAKQRIIEYEKFRTQLPHRKELVLIYQRRMRERNPGKYKARQKVNSALRSGRLIKGVCEVCGGKKVEAHHDDYRQYLKVRWLCRKHHLLLENKKPNLCQDL